jgi:GH25 family lysozyme M1 (1,4-beta-N-acetylmuramidase)
MRAKALSNDAAAAADDAANRAASFGIARGSAIYFDLESYGRKDAGCANIVLQYLGAWTSRLHARGYLAGVYSSAGSGITDLAHVAAAGVAKPDALWIARWDNGRTVQDASVPNAAWTPHLRIKQFTGGHKEAHGGVTMNIDRDWVDGPVARIG